MLNRLLGVLSKDVGIDLGTANTLVYVGGKGIVINEPSVVAVNTRTDQILAVGDEAKQMTGKTPAHIVVSRPLVDGVISDFEVAEKMLRYFIGKVHRQSFALVPRPRVVISLPVSVTEVERKAVEDAVRAAGAREVHLVEQPMAAGIGARLPVLEPTGSLVVEIGGGTTEIAVISLGGVVVGRSLRVAGDELNQNIVNFARDQFNLLLGERSAEQIKVAVGSVDGAAEPREARMRGRDLLTGLPREVTVTSLQIREAIMKTVQQMIEQIKATVESTPPELVSDIYQRGLTLSGGGALLHGLDRLISQELQIPVNVVDDPLTAVVRGTGLILEDYANLGSVLLTPADGGTISG